MQNEIRLSLNPGDAIAGLSRFDAKYAQTISRVANSTGAFKAVANAFTNMRNVILGGIGLYAIKNEMERIDSMRKSADALGISFNKLTRFSRAGMLGGFRDVEGVLSRGIEFLEKLRNGDKNAREIAKALNITSTANIDKLIAAVSAAKSMYLQTQVFGRGTRGRDVGVLLEPVEQSKITESFAKSIEAFNDAVSLFKEVIIQDIIAAFKPFIEVATTILKTPVSKQVAFGGLGLLIGSQFIGHFNRNIFASRNVPTYSTPGYFGFSGRQLVGFKDTQTAAYRFYSAKTSRTDVAAKIFMDGQKALTRWQQKLLIAMSGTLGASAILPAVAYLSKLAKQIASFTMFAGKLVGYAGVAGVAIYSLYKAFSKIASGSRTITSIAQKTADVVVKTTTTMRNMFKNFADWGNKLYDEYSRGTTVLSGFSAGVIENLFDLIGITVKQADQGKAKESAEKLNKLRLQAQAERLDIGLGVMGKRVDAINDYVNSVLSSIDTVNESLSNESPVDALSYLKAYSQELADKLTELNNELKLEGQDQAITDQINEMISIIEEIKGKTDQKIGEISGNLRGAYEKFLERIGVDVGEVTYEEIAEKYNKIFEYVTEYARMFNLSAEKYQNIYSQLYDKYINELQQKTDYGKYMESYKAQVEYFKELSDRAKSIIQRVNPYERLRSYIESAYEAFVNGFIDYRALINASLMEYSDTFKKGVQEPLVGHSGMSAYFRAQYTHSNRPIYTIQNILRMIYANGIPVRV